MKLGRQRYLMLEPKPTVIITGGVVAVCPVITLVDKRDTAVKGFGVFLDAVNKDSSQLWIWAAARKSTSTVCKQLIQQCFRKAQLNQE